MIECPVNQMVIGSWTTLRNTYSGKRKARIISQSFAHPPGAHFNQIFASVARLGLIARLMATAIRFMTMHQFDITSAYLKGAIDEEMFVEEPKYSTEAPKIIMRRDNRHSEFQQ